VAPISEIVMHLNLRRHPHPPHGESGASNDGHAPHELGELAPLAAQLGRLGERYRDEAASRGLASRVYAASVVELGAPQPVARIGWGRWVAVASAAAALGLVLMVPLGVLPTGTREAGGDSLELVAFQPAGTAERLVVGLYDRDVALDAIDLSTGDGTASLVLSGGHDAAEIESELQSLLAVGGAR